MKVADARFLERALEIEMRDADDAADVRVLTDAELNDVNGGYLAPIIAAGSIAFLVVMGWDNVGSKETQAAALGMGHLL